MTAKVRDLTDADDVTFDIVPAEPGWAVAIAISGESSVVDVIWEPVLAWRVETSVLRSRSRKGHVREELSSTAEPICLDIVDDVNPVFRNPSGRVYLPADQDIEPASLLQFLSDRARTQEEDRRRQLEQQNRAAASERK